MKKITADLIGILDHLGENHAHIVGHDWGGPISHGIQACYILKEFYPFQDFCSSFIFR